jgi:tripeptidyl-peptidase-1
LGIDSQKYVERTNVEFMKIGLRGVSIVVASGDSGANGRTDPDCTDSVLHPDFPASSPYVTSVGATQIVNPVFFAKKEAEPICAEFSCAKSGVEVAVSFEVSNFASGGGFSAYSATPQYQLDAVQSYLNNSNVVLPTASMFNDKGRGYPDVSALGNNFLCYDEGDVQPVGGTSASAPTWAGVLSQLNSHLIANGAPSIGFANPLLYRMSQEAPKTFQDVVKGDNKCTEQGCQDSCQGFEATGGWDPVTGLGTPNVAEMLKFINAKVLAKRTTSPIISVA